MYACPKCKSTDHISVEVTTGARLIQDKGAPAQTEVSGEFSWDGDSQMICDNCDEQDIAKRFWVDDDPPGYKDLTTHVKSVEQLQTGGNVMVTLVTLADGRVLGIDDCSVVLYRSAEDFADGGGDDKPFLFL